MGVNEIVIEKTGFYAIKYKVHINGIKLTEISCDGIIVST